MTVSERDYLRLVALGQLIAAKSAMVQARDALYGIEHPQARALERATKLVLVTIADLQKDE
jgi:hypothetical protein